MKNKKLYLNHKGKKFNLEVKECSFFERFRGLMFRKKESSGVLLFDFKKPVNYSIHSYFVFFRFLALWLDNKNNIIEKKLVSPFRFRVKPDKKFSRLVEIPFNKKYSEIVRFLVDE